MSCGSRGRGGEGGGVYPTSPRRRAMAAPRPDAPPVRRTVLPLREVRSGVCLRDSAVRVGERGWRYDILKGGR